jgi:hypothetical protein
MMPFGWLWTASRRWHILYLWRPHTKCANWWSYTLLASLASRESQKGLFPIRVRNSQIIFGRLFLRLWELFFPLALHTILKREVKLNGQFKYLTTCWGHAFSPLVPIGRNLCHMPSFLITMDINQASGCRPLRRCMGGDVEPHWTSPRPEKCNILGPT